MCQASSGRGQTLAEMALAWVLRDGVVTSVLIGASRVRAEIKQKPIKI